MEFVFSINIWFCDRFHILLFSIIRFEFAHLKYKLQFVLDMFLSHSCLLPFLDSSEFDINFFFFHFLIYFVMPFIIDTNQIQVSICVLVCMYQFAQFQKFFFNPSLFFIFFYLQLRLSVERKSSNWKYLTIETKFDKLLTKTGQCPFDKDCLLYWLICSKKMLLFLSFEVVRACFQ